MKKEDKALKSSTQVNNETKEKNITSTAHQQADKDIAKDPELNDKPAPEDGLDEGELARLEGQDDGEMDVFAEPE